MKTGSDGLRLRVFIHEGLRRQHQPLYAAIVEQARRALRASSRLTVLSSLPTKTRSVRSSTAIALGYVPKGTVRMSFPMVGSSTLTTPLRRSVP